MFVTKNRQKLYRYDRIADGGVFEFKAVGLSE